MLQFSLKQCAGCPSYKEMKAQLNAVAFMDLEYEHKYIRIQL